MGAGQAGKILDDQARGIMSQYEAVEINVPITLKGGAQQ